jgi:iron complex transport system substrate-binding protein
MLHSTSGGIKYFCIQAHPELLDLPTVGTYSEPNMEAILELKPDVVFSYSSYPDVADSIQEKTGIPVVCTRYVEPSKFDRTYESLKLTATILDKEERAEWLISYVGDKLDRITKITGEIPEEEKPKVYALVWRGITQTMDYAPVELAGGINVAKEFLLSQGLESAQINPEQVIIWNPDVIFLRGTVAQLLEDHAGLEATTAVKEGNVYQIFGPYICHDLIQLVVETYYMAKLLHPDEFYDLDVEYEANRMFEEVYGTNDLYNKVQEARGVELYRWE